MSLKWFFCSLCEVLERSSVGNYRGDALEVSPVLHLVTGLSMNSILDGITYIIKKNYLIHFIGFYKYKILLLYCGRYHSGYKMDKIYPCALEAYKILRGESIQT